MHTNIVVTTVQIKQLDIQNFPANNPLSLLQCNPINWYKRGVNPCVDIGTDANIAVTVISLVSQVVNDTTMTDIEVSIYILSWWNWINDE